MRRWLLTAAVLGMGLSTASAQSRQAGDFGLGIIVINPTGVTGKYWLDGTTAFDAAIGSDDGLSAHGDFLLHSWTLFPKPSQGSFAGYMGFGAGFRDDDDSGDDDGVKLRVPFGTAYYTPRDAFEIFLELVPVLEFADETDFDLDAALGFRVYFDAI